MAEQIMLRTVWAVMLVFVLSCAPMAAQDASEPPATPATAPATAPALAPGEIDLEGVDPVLLAPFKGLAEPVLDKGESVGVIDWGRKLIIAEGRSEQVGKTPRAEALAKRGASILAMRNAAALAAGVRMGADGRVANLRTGKIQIEAMLTGIRVTDVQAELVDGKTWWRAKVSLPLFGVKSLAVHIYDARSRTSVIRTMRRIKWVEAAPPEAVAGDVVVIDARGTGMAPSLFPVILSADQQVLLDSQTVGKDIATQRGLCAYATTSETFDKLQSMLPGRGVTVLRALAAGEGAEGNVDGLPLDRLVLAEAAGEASGDAKAAPATASAPARRKPRRLIVRADKADATSIALPADQSDKLRNDATAAALVKAGKVLIIVDAAAAGQEGRLDDLEAALRDLLATR